MLNLLKEFCNFLHVLFSWVIEFQLFDRNEYVCLLVFGFYTASIYNKISDLFTSQ